jgi:nucleoside-diphosphate-sugar epimerase
MYTNKHVLLIAGGGTLGTYTAEELLRLGARVDVLCPEDKISNDSNLVYHKGLGTEECLKALFQQTHYDGIVNFIHYSNPDDYKQIHNLLISNTDHLIFLSSYRIYADIDHPITENSPRINDTTNNKDYFAYEDYSNSKSIEEDFLFNECKSQNWTIVRPVISFSERRFDIYTYSGRRVFGNEVLKLPEFAKTLHAGIDWAGNSGKLIANLLFKTRAMGEAFTVSSGWNLTWDEVATIYTDEIGTEFEWVSEEEFLEANPSINSTYFTYHYDRKYNRLIDNSKVLDVTGLGREDLTPIREGLRIEIKKTQG